LEEVQGSLAPCDVGGPGRGQIMESRRKFLTTLLSAGMPAGILVLATGAQVHAKLPQNPAQSRQKEKEDESNLPKPDPKLILEANQKEIKKNVERLYDLASELKSEVEKTDSVQVLSIAMLRKTEEIEKLAKDIRSKAKG
jgi:hypothetical protein